MAVALCLVASTGRSDQNLETAYRRNGDAITSLFSGQQEVLQRSSAVIQEGRRRLAYGVVISPDGFLLTKASEIEKAAELNAMIDATPYSGARVVAVDPLWDVALVKVTAENLQPVSFSTTSEPDQGTWVVANGASSRVKRRVLAGIISANAREIPAAGGAALGLILKEGGKTLEIEQITPNSGAAEAGLQKGDVIRSIDGRKLSKRSELTEFMKERKAGSTAKVTIQRGGKEMALEVRLKARGEMSDQQSRNDQMSGEYSHRRTGFPRILQHDILSARDSVGGPLLDLDGRCVGMNIARADRAQSFAIPAKEVQEIAARLMKSKNE
ncbi:MAG TPA: trypsin-like peptidase domain-containing protein [Luteolibacter sp.]